MSKYRKLVAVVTGIVAVVAVAGAAFAVSAQEPTQTGRSAFGQFAQDGSRGNGNGPRGEHGPRDGGFLQDIVDQDAIQQVVADTLGISLEELTAAKEEGTRLPDLAEELGVDMADVEAAVRAEFEAQVNAAVDAGSITQEQADEILSHEGVPFGHRGGHGKQGGGILQDIIDQDAIKSVVADTLGLSVDELDAAKEAGTTLEELAEAQGVDMADVEAAARAEFEAQVNAAVDAGSITQEQADEILSHEGVPFGGNHNGHRGGPRNGNGQAVGEDNA